MDWIIVARDGVEQVPGTPRYRSERQANLARKAMTNGEQYEVIPCLEPIRHGGSSPLPTPVQ